MFFRLVRPMLTLPGGGDGFMAPKLDYTCRNMKAQENNASKLISLNHYNQSQNEASTLRSQTFSSHTQYLYKHA